MPQLPTHFLVFAGHLSPPSHLTRRHLFALPVWQGVRFPLGLLLADSQPNQLLVRSVVLDRLLLELGTLGLNNYGIYHSGLRIVSVPVHLLCSLVDLLVLEVKSSFSLSHPRE